MSDQGTNEQGGEALDTYIEGVKAAYAHSIATGKLEPLSDYLADDVVVLLPGSPPVQGKETWGEMFDAWGATVSGYEATYTTEERIVRDDLVVERGICHEGPTGADETEFHDYNYLWILRREENAGWTVSHKAWNRIR